MPHSVLWIIVLSLCLFGDTRKLEVRALLMSLCLVDCSRHLQCVFTARQMPQPGKAFAGEIWQWQLHVDPT